MTTEQKTFEEAYGSPTVDLMESIEDTIDDWQSKGLMHPMDAGELKKKLGHAAIERAIDTREDNPYQVGYDAALEDEAEFRLPIVVVIRGGAMEAIWNVPDGYDLQVRDYDVVPTAYKAYDADGEAFVHLDTDIFTK